MARWHVVEKDGFGTDWHQIRYNNGAMKRFDTKEEALKAAKEYLTEINCNNALTKEEKQGGSEAYMMLDDGAFLGVLDGINWYMKYPKDVVRKSEVIHQKNSNVKDSKWFELDGKTEVTVKEMPGT